MGGDKPKRQQFKRCPIGFFHVDRAEVQTAARTLFLFASIDRTSKFSMIGLVETADSRTAREFLQHMICEGEAVSAIGPMTWSSGREHRLTTRDHPWTNGLVERMIRTIEDATVERFHDDDHDQLRTRLADFRAAYNFALRLKTLGWLTR